jgi:hypothetical protein
MRFGIFELSFALVLQAVSPQRLTPP